MGKQAKDTEKARKPRRQEKQTRSRLVSVLTGLSYFVLLAICIGSLAAMPRINRAPARQNTWYLQNVKQKAAPTSSIEPEEPGATGEAQPVGESPDAAAQAAPALSAKAVVAPTPEEEPAEAEATPEPTEIPEPGTVTITITAAGDCTLGGSVNQNTYDLFKKVVQANGYDYFFANVRSIFQADDLTILNLEGPLTDVGTGRVGSYCFKGDPDYVQIMTGSSVELCNVANNHSADFGIEGLHRTGEVLEQAGIGCCGYTKVFHTTIKGVRITALGFDKWHNDKDGIAQVIQQERPNCDLLIVNMHWGREKHFEPMADQKTVGHAAIDAGADLVIGTHPHVYGGVELYKGKYIAYSLGNFCFGGNDNPSDKRCLIFQQTFVYNGEGQMGDGGINVIPCMVSSVTNKNDFKPTVMEPQAGTALLKAMARYSNFSKDGTLWMQNSYPEQIGLIQGDATQPAAQTAQPDGQQNGVQPEAAQTDVSNAQTNPQTATADATGDADIDEEARLRQLYQEQMMTE